MTRAARIITFIERYCRTPDGEHVGKPLVLAEFQKQFIRDVYDNPAGTRRAILSVSRKNGKTGLIAGLLLAHLVGPEAKLNAQLVSGAMSRDQAALVFKLASDMVRLSPYDVWAKQGFLHTTAGATVDYEIVAQDMAAILAGLDVQAIAYDRWRIDLLKKELERVGCDLPLVPWGQGYKDMAPALDALEAELLNQRIAHGGHPVLQMCAANAVVSKDPTGARKLDKSRATGRIDGMQALAMAIGVAVAAGEEQGHVASEFCFV